MKWFKDSIGDSMLIIGRMPALQRSAYLSLRYYYLSDEEPLVSDVEQLATMSGLNMRKKVERAALQAVLDRWFVLSPDGSRYLCPDLDRRIAAYQRGATDDDAQDATPGAARQRRLREERQRRRAALADIGLAVAADMRMPELRALCVQHLGATVSEALGDADASDETPAAPPVTQDEASRVTSRVTPVTSPLKSTTNNHQPSTTNPHPFGVGCGVGGEEAQAVTQGVTSRRDVTGDASAAVTPAAAALAAELAAGGLPVRAEDADLQRLAAAGWSAAAILEQQPLAGWASVTHPLPWLLAKLAKKQGAAGAPPPPGGAARDEPWTESVKGVTAKGVELGIGGWDRAAWERGEMSDWPSYRARVFKAAGVEPRAVA